MVVVVVVLERQLNHMKLHLLEMLVEEEEEDSYQLVTIVESLVISALNAIGHDEWEVTCIHFHRIFPTG